MDKKDVLSARDPPIHKISVQSKVSEAFEAEEQSRDIQDSKIFDGRHLANSDTKEDLLI
jgi:hypothetical protein